MLASAPAHLQFNRCRFSFPLKQARERGCRSGLDARRRPRGERGHEDLRRRRPVAQRCVGSDGIVMASPALDDNLRLTQRVEDLAIEQLVTQAGSRLFCCSARLAHIIHAARHMLLRRAGPNLAGGCD